jgi:polysaccharide biosynthesis transport protein
MTNQIESMVSTSIEDEPSIDLRQYLALFRQWWWLMVLATLLAAVAAYAYSSRLTPIYQASTTLLINQAASSTTTDYSSIITSERLASTYSKMMTKRPVMEEVANRLGANVSAGSLAGMITVTPLRDTQLIVIVVESEDAVLAADVANTVVAVFSDQIVDTQTARFAASKENLQNQIGETEAQMRGIVSALAATKDKTEIERLETRLNQYERIYANLVLSYEQIRLTEAQTVSNVVPVEAAVASPYPIRPRVMQNTLLAAVVGLMLSMGGIFAYDALDDTLKNPEAITRQLKLPILGSISAYSAPADGQLITRAQPRSPISESFRALRTNVQYASVDTPLRTLLITSPAPGDGKSTIASNLAAVISQSNKRVTIVDADLHRPRIHRIFETDQRPGLSMLFIRPNERLNGSLQASSLKRLSVVASGEIPPNPSELLGSNRMRQILNDVVKESDFVLVDTPPVLSVTDAVVLAPLVDGVLLVVRPGETKMRALKYAVEQLNYVGAKIVGVVLNQVSKKNLRSGQYDMGYSYKQYQYYQTGSESNGKTNGSHAKSNGSSENLNGKAPQKKTAARKVAILVPREPFPD